MNLKILKKTDHAYFDKVALIGAQTSGQNSACINLSLKMNTTIDSERNMFDKALAHLFRRQTNMHTHTLTYFVFSLSTFFISFQRRIIIFFLQKKSYISRFFLFFFFFFFKCVSLTKFIFKFWAFRLFSFLLSF